MVGPVAWVCSDHVELSRAVPWQATPPKHIPSGLPLPYYFVGRDGSLGYRNLNYADIGTPDYEFHPGFGIAIVRVSNPASADAFGLTTKGLWVPMRDVRPVRPNTFTGHRPTNGELNVAWVWKDEAPVYRRPGGVRSGEAETKHTQLAVLEQRARHGKRWFRIGEERWVSDRHVRAPRPAPPPEQLLPGERWIDVDIDEQVVTAYEGDRPVYVALASTGKGTGKSSLATPRGEFRVWVKLRSSDMTNLENDYANRYYAIEEVPWVLYFKKGYGLHGTFWHREFGRRRSHGCVNLTPLDAQWFFHWASPRLPTGWTAVLPTDYEPGTLVRVR